MPSDDGQPGQPAPGADLTIAELAARFHRSTSTIRGWCEQGRFEGAYKLNGRDWRIPQKSVDAFLNAQRGRRPEVGLGAWRAFRRVELLRQGDSAADPILPR